ncbi:MAG: GDP-mannose 4,6-dehydratase [Acidobacteriota bacterium]
MRILITGVTGFVGCHLARHLAADPDIEVHGLATHADRCQVPMASFYETDISDRDGLRQAIDTCAPDAIVHLAGLSHVGESWKRPGDYLRVNFAGTRNLVHAAKGRRVLFASSAEVYGYVPEDEQPITEDRPVEPRSPYAMTKACAEEIARDHGAIVVRSFNSIGPGQARHFALPSFASQLAEIRAGRIAPVLKVGDLSPRRDFLHVDDAVRGYETILRQGEDGGVYNLASGTSHSIADCLDQLRKVSGVDAEVEVDPARVRPVDIPLLQGDTSRLAALGWSPTYDLDAALHDLWREILDDATADA